MDNIVAVANAAEFGNVNRRQLVVYSTVAFASGALSVVSFVGLGLALSETSPPFQNARANDLVALLLLVVPLAFSGVTWFICDRRLPGTPDTLTKGRPVAAKIGLWLTIPAIAIGGNLAIIAAFT